jgi:diguanylate cyclase (GGDEF)-like protein
MNARMEATAVPTVDLTFCEREPIHIPGAIQPHGALLAVLADALVVTHASVNLALILGLSAEDALGKPIGAVLGDEVRRGLADAVASGDPVDDDESWQLQSMPGPRGEMLHLRAFRSGRHLCIDIQPTDPANAQKTPDALLKSAMETFARAARSVELFALAVRGIKAITGYDRVMAYRFAEDGHGEVIAEAREAHMEPYLGLHYPAADVPPQARRLFLRQRVCLIADTHYSPVSLLSDPTLDDGTPLDLSLSTLRSVSPIHRDYLRNMKVAASLSVALVRRNAQRERALWGLIVCHDETQRIAAPELQSVLGMIGEVVSTLLTSLDEGELYSQLRVRNVALKALVARLAFPLPSSGLSGLEVELLDLVGASGALVQVAGTTFTIGHLPPPGAIDRTLGILQAEAGGNVLAIDNLGNRYPELSDCTADGSGALLAPLSQTDDSFILWFRPERVRTVNWGGNPDLHVTADTITGRLSPRGSFAAWLEIERGRCVPWSVADIAIAEELRRSVKAVVAERLSAVLARLRHYDTLTGLPNRSLLEERLRDETDTDQALLFLDLDGFKAVNDTMGHPCGDALLIEVARRITEVTGPESLAVRLGGDEFVVLCMGLEPEAVAALAERIRRSIEIPIVIAGRSCRVLSSIGIAIAGLTGNLDLVRAADIAMYAAKQAGGNRAVLFEPSLYDRASLRFELEEDMRDALRREDEFVLLYQPLFGITSRGRRLAGFEALVRWRHPRHGWMSPATFIPLAEKSGLILRLGEWVLATALRQGCALRRAYPEANLAMNVNVSVLQISEPGYGLGVAAALAEEDYPATGLCLEVVESLLADAAAATVLAEIRTLGVKVAIDDFGVGYSSLSYLRRLPVDTVKLDRSFLEGIESDPSGHGFVAAVIALAHAAGKPVVFEGIETEAQFDIAWSTGADLVQGFFFAPPLSANACLDLARQQRLLNDAPPVALPHSA